MTEKPAKNSASTVPPLAFFQGGCTVGYPAANPRQHWGSAQSVQPSATYLLIKVMTERGEPGGRTEGSGQYIQNKALGCTGCTVLPVRPPTARQLRQLKRNVFAVSKWWAHLPDTKPVWFRPTTLTQSLHRPMALLAPALRALGWTRIIRRIHGKPSTLWLPPGSPIKRRPVGGSPMRTYF